MSISVGVCKHGTSAESDGRNHTGSRAGICSLPFSHIYGALLPRLRRNQGSICAAAWACSAELLLSSAGALCGVCGSGFSSLRYISKKKKQKLFSGGLENTSVFWTGNPDCKLYCQKLPASGMRTRVIVKLPGTGDYLGCISASYCCITSSKIGANSGSRMSALTAIR